MRRLLPIATAAVSMVLIGAGGAATARAMAWLYAWSPIGTTVIVHA